MGRFLPSNGSGLLGRRGGGEGRGVVAFLIIIIQYFSNICGPSCSKLG